MNRAEQRNGCAGLLLPFCSEFNWIARVGYIGLIGLSFSNRTESGVPTK